jgi:hypothetical protein
VPLTDLGFPLDVLPRRLLGGAAFTVKVKTSGLCPEPCHL